MNQDSFMQISPSDVLGLCRKAIAGIKLEREKKNEHVYGQHGGIQ